MQKRQVGTPYKLLHISSKAFKPNGIIPFKYTCEGEDINPPLDIDKIPFNAKSLVLIIEDPDAPAGIWLHWLAWNIPVIHHIRENEVPGDQGLNDFGKKGYGGPCPPSGSHRYFFKIYALDDLLDVPEGSGKMNIEEAMHDHILAFGELVGIYKKYHYSK